MYHWHVIKVAIDDRLILAPGDDSFGLKPAHQMKRAALNEELQMA